MYSKEPYKRMREVEMYGVPFDEEYGKAMILREEHAEWVKKLEELREKKQRRIID
jgi:hypothetical protein